MAITNYSELQTSVTNWLSRTNDTNLIALYPDFITFAESKFNRVFRTRNQEASATITPASGVCALPTDYLELRRLYINTDVKIELEYLAPEAFYLRFPSGEANSRYYTIEGANILLADRNTTTDLVILYYKKIPALSIANTSNWLLTAHPDLYLAEVLAEAYDVIKNEAQAQKWYNKAVMLGEQLIDSDKRGKYSGSAMRVVGV